MISYYRIFLEQVYYLESAANFHANRPVHIVSYICMYTKSFIKDIHTYVDMLNCISLVICDRIRENQASIHIQCTFACECANDLKLLHKSVVASLHQQHVKISNVYLLPQ